MFAKRRVSRKKRKMGATLLELIVALVILLIVIAPIYGFYTLTIRQSALVARINAATITAQLRIEEMVGRAWAGDLEYGAQRPYVSPSPTPEPWNTPVAVHYNGFYVSVVPMPGSVPNPSPSPLPTAGAFARPLSYPTFHFEVRVYEAQAAPEPLITMEHIINVHPGGFVP